MGNIFYSMLVVVFFIPFSVSLTDMKSHQSTPSPKLIFYIREITSFLLALMWHLMPCICFDCSISQVLNVGLFCGTFFFEDIQSTLFFITCTSTILGTAKLNRTWIKLHNLIHLESSSSIPKHELIVWPGYFNLAAALRCSVPYT